ncbi:MAG: aminotransferase class I/II-fold pyridoxal phosphate-dependent enzyme [Planctomycetota bacterium]
MGSPLERRAARWRHLQQENLLRSLTEVINKVPEGINLGQGVCDLDTPGPLQVGSVASIQGGDRQTYTHYTGLPELKAAIAAKLRTFNGLDYGADQILVATGSSGAFFAAATALLDPGDEVVLFEPFYSYHHTALRVLGVQPVCVPLRGAAFDFDPEALRAALTPRTRAVMVNTPANPSGKVFTPADLDALAAVLADTDVMVFTDEVYEYMCFDGRRHVSPATVPALADRTLTFGGFSKTFSITGWRIGYLAGPADVVDAAGRVFDQMNVCAPRPLQRGVQQALTELPASFYTELQAGYERKRDRFCAALANGGFRFSPPQGAYYVMADYREVLGDLEAYPAVLQLIERVGINGVPGSIFYEDGASVRTIRFQFAVTPEVLDDVCRRLESLGAG